MSIITRLFNNPIVTGAVLGGMEAAVTVKTPQAAIIGAASGAIIFAGEKLIAEHVDRIYQSLVYNARNELPARVLAEPARQYLKFGLLGAAVDLTSAMATKMSISALPGIAMHGLMRDGAVGFGWGVCKNIYHYFRH